MQRRKKKPLEEQFIIETNIDDMNAELFQYVEERLFDAGALDVYRTAIIMKKGRMAVKLSVLTKKSLIERIERVIFTETTSIGLRKYPIIKVEMDREMVTIETKYGAVKAKKAYLNGNLIKVKPEYEDCKRLAEINKVSIGEVYRIANRRIEESHDE